MVLEALVVSQSFRELLGMTERLPHFTTLQKFGARSQMLAIGQRLLAEMARLRPRRARFPSTAIESAVIMVKPPGDYFRARRPRSQ